MAIELRVNALPPIENNVLGVPQITVFGYEFSLHWLGGDPVKFDDLRIRTFMYHHYASITGQEAFYGPDISSGAPPIVLTRASASDVLVSWDWDSWMTDIHPPRIDDELAPLPPSPDPSVPDRYYKFSQEITLYPGTGTNEQLDAINPDATGAQVSYAGQQGDAVSTIVKFGRFNDVQNSYSYLHPNDNGGSPITSPDNYVLEQRIGSWNISSINQVGSTVTVTTSTPHGFLVGEGVTINDVLAGQGIVYNGNFKVTSVPSVNSFTYESRSFLNPTPGVSGNAEKWQVISGIIPSTSVAVNYASPPVGTIAQHTSYTSLIYAEKDTSISESNGIPLNSTQWGISASLPVQNYNSGGTTNIKKAVWKFPVGSISPSATYKSEINFYNIQANTGNVVFDLFQVSNDTWSETNLATGTWSYINPLIDDSSPVSTYTYDSNSNQVDEFTYTKFDVPTSKITDWVNGSSVPDVALVKRSDIIFEDYFFVSEDAATEPFVELRPFIIISGSQAAADTTPPSLSLTNTISDNAILSASGDGAGTITYALSDASKIEAGDKVNIRGTGIYDGVNLTVSSVSLNDVIVSIVGNTETAVINAGILNTPSIVTASVEAVDNDEIDATPANISILQSLSLIPVTPENIVKNVPSTMTFDFTLDGIDDGYYQVQVQDISSNLSPLLTDAILMEVSKWDGVNPPEPNPSYVRTNDQLLITGFNIEGIVSSFRRVSGDINDGGLIVSPPAISILNSDLEPSLNGFKMLVPSGQSNEYAITAINTTNNTFSVSNAPNFYVGLAITFAHEGIVQEPIIVGKTYYIESVSYVGTTAIISISETLGGSSLGLIPTANVGQMYLYNKSTPLHVIRNGVSTSDYNNIVTYNVDDFGPIITIPSITTPNTSIQILATDPAGVNPLSAVVTFGNITGSTDVNGDGTVYVFDVDVGPTSGTLRFTVRDVLGNERFAEEQIPIVSDVFVKILNYNIINANSFILRVQVVGNTVPVQIATGAGDPGVFVADSVNNPYGTISNLIDTPQGLEFDLNVSSIGDGVFKIWGSDGVTTDTLTPIVITSLLPTCLQTGDVLVATGANLGYPGITPSTTTGAPGTILVQTMTEFQAIINGTIEGVSNFVLTGVIDGDNVSSNEEIFTLDNTPPVIDIIGDEFIQIIQNSGPYVDQGAIAVDQLQGGVAVSASGVNNVDTTTIGIYEIIYTANDGCGNTSQAIRVVSVITGCDLSIALSPAIGKIGDVVNIFAVGGTFNPVATENIVTFNDVIATILEGTLTSLKVQVPFGANSGLVQVETQDSECGISNPTDFTVVFDDERFESSDVLNLANRRRGATQGNVSIFDNAPWRAAIYNRDYAYSNYSEVVDENSMIQNVASIVLTKQGERIMNPEFGTRLESYIFNPVGDVVDFQQEVLNEIKRAVNIYEPRVTIDLSQSIARFDIDTNEMQVLLSLILPSGVVRELGLTLSSIKRIN